MIKTPAIIVSDTQTYYCHHVNDTRMLCLFFFCISVPEEIYEEAPYSVTPGTARGKGHNSPELGPRFPSKRGLEINETWGNRQSIPLPPRPDENPTNRVKIPPRCTPPPAYKDAIGKSVKVDNANINPVSVQSRDKYAPKEGVYFTPLSGGDTPPVGNQSKPSIIVDDDAYLTPREMKSSQSNQLPGGSDIDTEYLTPVSGGKANKWLKPEYKNVVPLATPEDSDVDYMTPVNSLKRGEHIIKPDGVSSNQDIDTQYLTPVQAQPADMPTSKAPEVPHTAGAGGRSDASRTAGPGDVPHTVGGGERSEYLLQTVCTASDTDELIPSDHESDQEEQTTV